MTSSTTLTVRLTTETKDQLGRLAAGARRTKSFLAAEAIEAYVKQQLEIVEGIQLGLDDVRAGRLVPHEQAMQQVQDVIDRRAGK